jgi:ATP-dependent exoDNAse (exonuclease V) alpha subunit
MSIYHFSAKTISRSAGRSATAAAAYRAGEKIVDARTGEVHDYTRKGGVLSRAVVLPGGTTMPRSELWNAVELKHKRGDALVAREFEIALPHELSHDQRESLITAYARELADTYQVAIDVNVHAPSHDEKNYHAHVMLSACYVDSAGVCGKKAVELDPIHCKRAGIDNAVDVQRKRWQDVCNVALEKAGSAARIDHRTLEAQGITDRPPGVHLGPAATAIMRRSEPSTIAARAQAAADAFLARAAADAAHAAAAVAAVTELERELAQAQQDAARTTGSRDELVRELEPLHARLRQAQVIIDAGAQRRPKALPEAKVLAAQKALPGLQAKADKAAQRARKIDSELGQLGWWRPFKKASMRRDLELAKQDAAALQTRLAACKATAAAAAVEVIDRVVAEQKSLQAELAPRCWPIEARIREMEIEMTAQTDQELAAAAKARLEQTGAPPRADELGAIDRILIEQARIRIEHAAPQRERERERQR